MIMINNYKLRIIKVNLNIVWANINIISKLKKMKESEMVNSEDPVVL
jgi:hypothetical protein